MSAQRPMELWCELEEHFERWTIYARMLLSRGIKLGASADYSLAPILIQEGMGALCLAHMIVKLQSWNEGQATGGDVPLALSFPIMLGELTGATGVRQEWLQEKRMGRKQPVRSSFNRTESHFSLLHAASATWDSLDCITVVMYLHHIVIVTGAAIAQKNFLCSVWCWSQVGIISWGNFSRWNCFSWKNTFQWIAITAVWVQTFLNLKEVVADLHKFQRKKADLYEMESEVKKYIKKVG